MKKTDVVELTKRNLIIGMLCALGTAMQNTAASPGGNTGEIQPIITTVAGSSTGGAYDWGDYGGDGGPATEALLNDPTALAIGPDGGLYIADTENHRIRRVNGDGTITTVAGTGEEGFSGDDGKATEARLNFPKGLAFGPDGSLYINDDGNHRVRRIDPEGKISTVAGGGKGGLGDGGPATEARLDYVGEPQSFGFGRDRYLVAPKGLAVAADETIYVVDDNSRVRIVRTDGIISTVAGGENTGLGDGGPAPEAKLDRPAGISLGPDGSLYIADRSHNRIRRVNPDGIITTVAGTGKHAHAGDGGPATEAALYSPVAVAVASDGSLFTAEMPFGAAETDNHHVRQITPDGIIRTIAGTSRSGNDGDGGPAIEAQLRGPNYVVLDSDGNLYVTDTGNHRVRRIATRGDGPGPFAPAPRKHLGTDEESHLTLRARAGDTVVELSWIPPDELEVAGYRVYYAGSTRPIHGNHLLNTPEFIDIGLTNGWEYTYMIVAVLTDGSEWKEYEPVSATPGRRTE